MKPYPSLEDNAVSVRTKSLGKDRNGRTYWWGVGGEKGVVYVEDVDGKWGVFSERTDLDSLMEALHVWGANEKVLKQNLQRRVHTIHAEFRKRERREEEEDEVKEEPNDSTRRPSTNADETVPFSDAKTKLTLICVLAQSAAKVRSDGTLGNPDGSDWVEFSTKVSGANSNDELSTVLIDVEDSLRNGQLKEFMDPQEAADRAAAAEAGEEYESDEEEDFPDDDEYDDEQVFGDARDMETYESKCSSGMIYPIFDTKFERLRWKEGVHENTPASGLAFSVATLEDAAKPFLKALIKHPR